MMEDFELVMAEAHRLRREAEGQLDTKIRQTLEDAAGRLELKTTNTFACSHAPRAYHLVTGSSKHPTAYQD